MAWWRRPRGDRSAAPRPDRSPKDVPAGVLPELQRGEQVLATAQEDASGHWVVLTTWRLLERTTEGGSVTERPWHEVDSGAWDPDEWLLTVDFVDGGDPRRWRLRDRTGPGSVPVVLRDRTTASVVLTRGVDLGPRRTARVTVRKVLDTRELVEQVLLGPGARLVDAQLARAVHEARRDVRDQAGLDPDPPQLA
ncbi:MAG TPA: hypothetical protein VLO09_09570 [Ornithinimicrobium sp.]|nr:hypothetical protein [Ornithinimicrobium sp.]